MDKGRQVAVGGAALLLAAVVLATVLLVAKDDGSRVGRARERAVAASRAASALQAGESLAVAGELLRDEAAACDERRGGVACSAWRSAAAYAQVAAVEVLRCTAPGRVQASRAVVRYIDDVRTATGRSVPDPPPLPRCAFARPGR